MKVAVLKISRARLIEALGLPLGTSLRTIRTRWDELQGDIEVQIEHTDLIDVREGYRIPMVRPVFDEHGFKEWGA